MEIVLIIQLLLQLNKKILKVICKKQMSQLFTVSIDNISLHIKNIIADNELDNSVIEEYSITASDGKKYKTKIYNLDMIISVGYRVKSKRGV